MFYRKVKPNPEFMLLVEVVAHAEHAYVAMLATARCSKTKCRRFSWEKTWRWSPCRTKSSSNWAWRSSTARRFARRWCSRLANDIDFYVPTRKAFGEGSYEVTTSSYQPGGGELLVEGAVKLLDELKKGEGP